MIFRFIFTILSSNDGKIFREHNFKKKTVMPEDRARRKFEGEIITSLKTQKKINWVSSPDTNKHRQIRQHAD